MENIEKIAQQLREDIIKMLVNAGSGHTAGPLGMADVVAVLFFGGVLKYDSQNVVWEERDRLVLSNGHICPLLYAAMAHAKYFPHEELMSLRSLGSRLQGHPHRRSLPGLETTSGPLGSGLSQAAGMAYWGMVEKRNWRVYCLSSDGEHQEGNWWEGVMFAGKHHLSNLTLLVDRNNIQIDGYTEEVMPLESLVKKYEAFNWHVLEVDGHNHQAIESAFRQAQAVFERPTVIVAHTIPGKGVDFMESLPEWHGKLPNAADAVEALYELRTLGGKITSEHE